MTRLLLSAIVFAALASQTSFAQAWTPEQLTERTIQRRTIDAQWMSTSAPRRLPVRI
jgi:hypothetical protein